MIIILHLDFENVFVSITLIHHFCINTRNVLISTIFVHQRHDFERCLYKHNINTPFLQEKSNVMAKIIILHFNFEHVFVSITLVHHFSINTRYVLISTIFVHQKHDFESCLCKHDIHTP